MSLGVTQITDFTLNCFTRDAHRTSSSHAWIFRHAVFSRVNLTSRWYCRSQISLARNQNIDLVIALMLTTKYSTKLGTVLYFGVMKIRTTFGSECFINNFVISMDELHTRICLAINVYKYLIIFFFFKTYIFNNTMLINGTFVVRA